MIAARDVKSREISVSLNVSPHLVSVSVLHTPYLISPGLTSRLLLALRGSNFLAKHILRAGRKCISTHPLGMTSLHAILVFELSCLRLCANACPLGQEADQESSPS